MSTGGSYAGGIDYMPVGTVDEVADYTDMQGEASQMNIAASAAGEWRSNPTKMLLVFWVFLVVLYFLLSAFFRRYTA